MRIYHCISRCLAVILLVVQLASCASHTGQLLHTPVMAAEEGEVTDTVVMTLVVPILLPVMVGFDLYELVAGEEGSTETDGTYAADDGAAQSQGPSQSQSANEALAGTQPIATTYTSNDTSQPITNHEVSAGAVTGYTGSGSLSADDLASKCVPPIAVRRRLEAESCDDMPPDRSKVEFCRTMVRSKSGWSDTEWEQSSRVDAMNWGDDILSRAIEHLRYQLNTQPYNHKQLTMQLEMYECFLRERRNTPRVQTSRAEKPVPELSVAQMLAQVQLMRGSSILSFQSANSGDPCRGEVFSNPLYEMAMAVLPDDVNSQTRGAMVGIDLQLLSFYVCPDSASARVAVSELIEQRNKAMAACRAIAAIDNCQQSPF